MNVKSQLIALCVLLCVPIAAFAKGRAGHQQDIIDCLFDAQKNEATKSLSDFISQGMDMGSGNIPVNLGEAGSSYANTLKKTILAELEGKLSGTGSHRSLGHWNFDGDIPRAYLKTIEELEIAGKTPVGSQQVFIDTWREFVASRTEAVKQVFNISGPKSDRAARSFAAMCSDVHNLGDWATIDWHGIRSLDQIVDDYCRSGNRFLGKNNGLTKVIKEDVKRILSECDDMAIMKEFRKLPSTLSDAEKASEIVKFADKLNDAEFAKAIKVNTRGLKGDAWVREVLSIPKKYSRHKVAQKVIDSLKYRNDDFYTRIGNIFGRMGFDGNWKNIDWEKLGKFTQEWRAKNVVTPIQQSARIRNLTVAGKNAKAIDIPVVVENGKITPASEFVAKNPSKLAQVEKSAGIGAKQGTKAAAISGSGKISKWLASPAGQGISAGVLTFVIKEGETVVAYSRGTMESDEFMHRTTFNAGMAIAEGGSVYLISAAMAGAPVALTVGAMVISGIVIEQAGEYIWYRIDREIGIFPGVSVDDLLFNVRPEDRERRTALDDLKDLEKGRRITAPVPYSEIK